MELYTKKCPICKEELSYKSKSNLLRPIRNNSVCIFCLNRRKISNKEYIKKLSLSKIGDKNPTKKLDVKAKISKSSKGRKHTDEFKQKVSLIHKGKITSDATKQKMREAVLKRIKSYGPRARNFNPKACQFIDEINKQNQWHLQHALNGGEIMVCGYSLDGYDKHHNIVLEYDEAGINHFKNGILKEKDIKRMNEVIKYLQCRFLRYNENTKELQEYDQNGRKNTVDI